MHIITVCGVNKSLNWHFHFWHIRDAADMQNIMVEWPVLLFYTQWLRSHATCFWYMFYLSENKLQWNWKTKKHVTLSAWNVYCIQQCMHSLFTWSLSNPAKSSSIMEIVHQIKYCQFFLHRKIKKCTLKLILASTERTRCQAAFNNEHSLHL